MTSLETYQNRFDESAWPVFRRMLRRAQGVGYAEIGDGYLIRELIDAEGEVFAEFFSQLNVDPDAIRARLDERINIGTLTEHGPVRLDSSLIDLLKSAWNRARANGRELIAITDLLATSAQISESSLVRLLVSFGADLSKISTAMLACIKPRESEVPTAFSQSDLREESIREGDVVRILSGPFTAFSGRVRQVDPSRSTVTVTVNALRKLQTVELLFSEVQKLQFS